MQPPVWPSLCWAHKSACQPQAFRKRVVARAPQLPTAGSCGPRDTRRSARSRTSCPGRSSPRRQSRLTGAVRPQRPRRHRIHVLSARLFIIPSFETEPRACHPERRRRVVCAGGVEVEASEPSAETLSERSESKGTPFYIRHLGWREFPRRADHIRFSDD